MAPFGVDIPIPSLGALAGAVGTAVLQRTYLMEVNTTSGIPRVLIVIDSVQEEEPTYEADVTEHPVEQGTEVTDHIQLKNPTLRIKGTISNTPLDLTNSIGNLLAGAQNIISSPQAASNFINSGVQQVAGAIGASLLGGAGLSAGGLLASAADALARTSLLSAYERKARFNVVTLRTTYTNMVIESMTFPRDTSTGYALIFELNLKQIRVVSPQTVQLGTTDESVANSATSILGQGNQAPQQITPQTGTSAAAANSSTGFNNTQASFKAGQ